MGTVAARRGSRARCSLRTTPVSISIPPASPSAGSVIACLASRSSDQFAEWESAIAQAPLTIVQTRDISDEVLRGMECNAARSEALICQRLPKFLHSLGRDFAGLPGSRVYEALKARELSYRSWCFQKA